MKPNINGPFTTDRLKMEKQTDTKYQSIQTDLFFLIILQFVKSKEHHIYY